MFVWSVPEHICPYSWVTLKPFQHHRQKLGTCTRHRSRSECPEVIIDLESISPLFGGNIWCGGTRLTMV